MSVTEPRAGSERPFRVDEAWSRASYSTRTGGLAEFLRPHLRAGMRLIDCGCGPGTITADLAQAVAPGETVGVDVRDEAVAEATRVALERRIENVTFRVASVYELPYADASFDAAFACAVLQHLAAPLEALKEIRRVLAPGGVVGIVDGSSTAAFRYPTNPVLDAWDGLLAREREYRTGRPARPLQLRVLLREAGFARSQAWGSLGTEAGPAAAGTPEETRRVADAHLIRLRGTLGKLAVAEGWVTREELERMAEALAAWGEAPDAFYARTYFRAIGWA